MSVDRNRIDANDRAKVESIAQLLSHAFEYLTQSVRPP
jgi:hypothetical protein